MLTSPLHVDFNITNYCNLGCKFCYMKKFLNTECMDIRKIYCILKEFKVNNIMKINISGGEPFLHTDFNEIINILKKYNMHYSLSTNGTVIKDSHIKKLLEFKPDFIGISHPTDSSNELKNRRIMDKLTVIEKNIKKLYNCGLPISISFTITKHNIERIIPSIMKLSKIAVLPVGLQYIVPKDDDSLNQIPDYNSYSVFFNKLTDLKKKGILKNKILLNTTNESTIPREVYLPLRNRIEDLVKVWGYSKKSLSTKEFNSCTSGKTSIAVNTNGDVFGCEMLFNYKSLCYGNIFDKDLKEIRENRKLFDIQKSKLIGKCSTCDLDICNGACRASAMFYGGLSKSDLRCPYRRCK